jgi:hypothetical protein
MNSFLRSAAYRREKSCGLAMSQVFECQRCGERVIHVVKRVVIQKAALMSSFMLRCNAESAMRYSCLSAIIGSTWVARRAGIQQASSATPSSIRETARKVTGSAALTP